MVIRDTLENPEKFGFQNVALLNAHGDPFDVHAGAFETATMSELFPGLVHSDVALSAKPTCLANEQIDQWLSGEEQYTDIISSGYVGDPASYQKVHPTPQQYYVAIADHLMKTFPKALS